MAAFLEVLFAFLCAVGACGVALHHIHRHLCNYTEPVYQRYTVRIILMVPVSVLTQLTHLSRLFLGGFGLRSLGADWVSGNFITLGVLNTWLKISSTLKDFMFEVRVDGASGLIRSGVFRSEMLC